jgi:hypothetical protein
MPSSRLLKLFTGCLYQTGAAHPLIYMFPTLRWMMDTPLETPSQDPVVQRIVNHLTAAQVGLLTAADGQAKNTTLLEGHQFVWQALKVLSRAAKAESASDQKIRAPHVSS